MIFGAHVHRVCTSWRENRLLPLGPIKVPVSNPRSVGRQVALRRLHVDFLLFFEIRSVDFVMALLCSSSAAWIPMLISTNRALFSWSQRVVLWISGRATDDSGSAQSHRWHVLLMWFRRLLLAIQPKTEVLRRSGLIPRLWNPIMKCLILLIMLFKDLRATGSTLAEVCSVEYVVHQRSLIVRITTVLAHQKVLGHRSFIVWSYWLVLGQYWCEHLYSIFFMIVEFQRHLLILKINKIFL